MVSVLFAVQLSFAQKVGLVLSGGGAKGMTHIGIIRALEENNIPIDYIAGTSMGAIVGSLYAMGYSPDDMEALLKSPDFKTWYSGQIEPQYEYYFKKNRATPELFNIRFDFKDSLHINPVKLPTSMINPIQMNLVFVELFARSTAACRGNFNRLFVPFRCIASDVYNKKPLIMRNGDLGDAVRASMSFPFVFKPIEIDSVLAYDGGIYNNFPTDIMRQDFKPDIIIGSVVAANPSKPKENDLMSQIENMVMQKTDYSLPDSLGILMTFKYDDVSLMDFDRLKELHDIGYKRTMELMDSIKGRIPRRVSAENIRLRRMLYRKELPQLRFRDIYIDGGVNEQQQAYIKKEFHSDEDEIFSYEDLKRGYFRLLADNMISEIIPHAIYDPLTELYSLRLKVKMEDSFSVRVGGSVSSSSSNQIYLGVGYQNLNYYSKEVILDGQIGKIYNNAQLLARIDLPTHIPTSLRFIASYSTFDYYKKDKLFSRTDKPSFNTKDERFAKLMVALPFMANKRAEIAFGVGRLEDSYFQTNTINFEKDRSDKSVYRLLGGSIGFYGSTLNARQYASKGYYERLLAQVFTGNEKFLPGNADDKVTPWKERQSWLQISYMKEAYHSMTKKFILGWRGELAYSSKNFSENYTATMMQACDFSPTPHSKLMYNEAFRANQYLAAGIKPIIAFNDMFQLRTEFYGFAPIFPIKKNAQNKAYYGKAFSEFEYMGEISVVCQLPFGAISAYVNHYSSPKKEWNVGLTLGWQLFNYRFIE